MKTYHWSPLHINLMLHVYTTPSPIANHDAPAVVEFLAQLEELGLIQSSSESGSGYNTTERGQAFIALLGCTPLPEHAWVDPTGRKIDLR